MSHSTSYAMSLAELLPDQQPQLTTQLLRDLQLTGLSLDSRAIEPGDGFVACNGTQQKGVDFIDNAIANGAVAVLVNANEQVPEKPVPVVLVDDLEQSLGQIGSRFYRDPSCELTMVGITGTNGKTSTSHFIAQALEYLGQKAAVIGTVGTGFLGQLSTATHTTPDVLTVHRILAELRDANAEQVVMEVSSHALDQNRVSGVAFDQAVFTNLSRDHLDYHGTMENYGASKSQLFQNYGARQAVINLDDPYAATLLNLLPADVEVTGYGMAASDLADRQGLGQIWVEHVELSEQGLAVSLVTPWGPAAITTHILGSFNLYNLMASVAVLAGQGFAMADIEQAMAKVQAVPGRMQTVVTPVAVPFKVVVDYAHTPDALEKALSSLRPHCQGQLWCVFGCGGDRDTGKRPEMARISEALADVTMITSDNPRSEDPESIIKAILTGFDKPETALVEADRGAAIAAVLQQAKAGDVVLLAGKGHEDYQEIDGVRHPFDDVQVASEFLSQYPSLGNAHPKGTAGGEHV